LEIPSNKIPADPTYDYKKAYNKYYKNDKNNKDNKEDFYRNGNDSQVTGGSSENNYSNNHPTTLPSLAVPNM